MSKTCRSGQTMPKSSDIGRTSLRDVADVDDARHYRTPRPRFPEDMHRIAATTALGAATLVGAYAGHRSPPAEPDFRVIAFFAAKLDAAHISFVREAAPWFQSAAAQHHFAFDTSSDWTKLNDDVLARYDVVVFLDTRPEDAAQRAAFQRYMARGGAWMGFHFAGFALT